MFVRFFVFSCLFLFGSSAFSERYDITADIGLIRYHEASNTLASTWKKRIWFGIKNHSSVPDCFQYWGEYAINIPDGNEAAVSMVLSAKMSQSKVVITIDDSVKFAGYCQLQYITLL